MRLNLLGQLHHLGLLSEQLLVFRLEISLNASQALLEFVNFDLRGGLGLNLLRFGFL